MPGQKKRLSLFLTITIFLMLMFVNQTWAQDESPRRCADFKLPVSTDGRVDRTAPVIVIRDETPVYETPDASSTVMQLSFNTKLRISRIQEGKTRIQVGSTGSERPLGWVEGADLLCAFNAMKNTETGLEKIFFIKIDVEVQNEQIKTVKAYPWPDRNDCPRSGCRELSRFERFFVFDYDQENKRYLLANYSSLKSSESLELYGWVNEPDGFIWDTAYGLRPREDLVFPKGHKMEGEPMTVPVYKTLEDAKAGQNAYPVLGGPIWYRYEMRLPLITREGNFYKVVFSAPGTGVNQISPDTVGLQDISSINNLKKVDIFFLIDGSRSMQPFIDAVRGTGGRPGVVQQIVNTFSQDVLFEGTQFRFGFRIYRDTYAGGEGIGEGLPLSNKCELTNENLNTNREEFGQAISKVSVTTNDADDFEENLFGGIRQALTDINPCPEHTKILFIIGDAGYNPQAQRTRGITPVKIDYLITRMKGDRNEGSKTIVPFFLQTPNNSNNTDYNRAYDLFTAQGGEIINGILKPVGLNNEQSNYRLNTNDHALLSNIITAVKKFVPPGDLSTEARLDLRGGMSLVKTIERMKGKYDMPILFWENAINGSCEKLGKQCNERIYNVTLEGYIPISGDIVEDISVKADDLFKWIDLLRRIDEQASQNVSGKTQRASLVGVLKENLEHTLGHKLDNCGTLRDCLSRIGGLPVNDKSPLFKYSMDQLMDINQVPDCEINRIKTWIHNTRQMLSVVNKGEKKPIYKAIPFPGDCTSGSHIPYIDGDIGEAWLCPTLDCSWKYPIQRTFYYWVPKEYMP